jgi:phage tail sheath gpL-like
MASTIQVAPIVPSNWNLPGFNYKITAGAPAVSGTGYRYLLIAQTTTASAATTTPQFATSVQQIAKTYGYGSSIALLYAAVRENDQFTETYVLPLPDPSGSACEVVLSIAPTTQSAYGQIPLLAAGASLPVITNPGDTAGSIYNSIVTTVNQTTNLPFTASTDGSTGVTLTAKNVGVIGNFDVRFGYYGPRNGEVMPDGVTITTTVTNGVGAPDLAAVFATLPELQFSQVFSPYSDVENTNAVIAQMGDISGAWSDRKQLFGEGVIALNVGSAAGALTWVNNFNSQFISALPIQNSPEPIYQVLGKSYGFAGFSTSVDPGTPLQNVQLGFLAPALEDQWDSETRNALVNAGLSTFRTDNTGTVWAEDFVTSYTTDSTGQPDNTFRNLETMNCVADIVQFLKAYMLAAYPRPKLFDDNVSVPTIQNATTANTMLASLNSGYKQLCNQLRADQYAFFVANSAVQRNGNEVRFYAPITPPGQGKQINIQFSVFLG